MIDLETMRQRLADEEQYKLPFISVSSATCGRARGSLSIVDAFRQALDKHHLKDKIRILVTGCHGFCAAEPNVIIYPEQIFYRNLDPTDVEEIVSETFIQKNIVSRLVCTDDEGKQYPYVDDIPFYRKQMRIITGQNPFIDPTSIDDYLGLGGYKALEQVLKTMAPEDVIQTVKNSQLRGRGGAGFPTGFKWEFGRKAKGNIKYIICNADEGDPGAYMDRSLLEGNPHSVLEGMIIGAYAIGSEEGWIYVRDEYPLAIKHVTLAIEQATSYGLLGENILGSGFNLDINIIRGAGAFVCGEETALIQSIEGSRGVPRQRPPFPVSRGLWGKPTVINNVETWANVTKILERGAEWFSGIGTETSKGTKIFSLVGKIRNTGLVEVPMGITLKEIVFDIGQGSPSKKKIKAVQTGGPSGGCIPAKLFDLPVDYKSLTQAGSIMGSGGMIVMDENTCLIDVAKYFTNFLQYESCGKCVPCREGTQRMFEILTDITQGKGTDEDFNLLEELGTAIKETSLCGLGQTAPNPVLSALHHFKNEFIDHVKKKRCEASVCQEIVSSPCQHSCPIDTEASVYIALIAQKRYPEALQIIKKDNPFASVLGRVCYHPCETKCRAGEGGDPIAIRNLKRFVTDYGVKQKLLLKVEPVTISKKEKVAIIGSGPAGLTCGFYLAQKGYPVTIFEKLPVIGGMLAVAIPEYRLPRTMLQHDLDYIRSSGIHIQTNSELGKDFTLKDLSDQGYQAVFIATGAHRSRRLNIPGEDATGVLPAMRFLSAINLGQEINIGKKVGVIGGGNSAVDAARAALRAGAPESVTVFYRRTIAEMPVYPEEVEAALAEGIKIEYLVMPKKILTEGGKFKACQFIRMALGEIDESGRRTPLPIEGSEFEVKLDTLIIAIGEQPDISFAQKETGLEVSARGTLTADQETLLTTKKGVFAGGDVMTGPGTVVGAVACGKIAAESIDQLFSGKKVRREYQLTRPSQYIEPIEMSDEELEVLLVAKRPQMKKRSFQDRVSSFAEVECGLTEKQAIGEAKRCLRCELETEDGKRFLEKLKGSVLAKQEV